MTARSQPTATVWRLSGATKRRSALGVEPHYTRLMPTSAHARVLAVAVVLGACGGEPLAPQGSFDASSRTGTFEATFSSLPDPPTTGTNALGLELRQGGGPVVDAMVTLEPWMPAHGHGSSKAPLVTNLGAGAYRAEDIYLTMPGYWELTIEVSAGGERDLFVLDYDVKQ